MDIFLIKLTVFNNHKLDSAVTNYIKYDGKYNLTIILMYSSGQNSTKSNANANKLDSLNFICYKNIIIYHIFNIFTHDTYL